MVRTLMPISFLMLPLRKVLHCQDNTSVKKVSFTKPEEFSIEFLENNLNSKFNIIIIVQPDFWPKKLANKAKDGIKLLMKILDDDSRLIVLKTSEVKAFEERFNVKIKSPTFLLVKSKYGPEFKKFTSFNPEKILKFLNPFSEVNNSESLSKLSTIKKDQQGTIVYIPKEKNKHEIDKSLAKLGSSKSFAELNKNFIFKISDEKIAQSLGIDQKPNEFFLIQKESKFLLKEENSINLEGKKFRITSLNNTNIDNIDESIFLHVKHEIFRSRIFEPSNFRGGLTGSLILYVDENKADPKIVKFWVSILKNVKGKWMDNKDTKLRDNGIYYVKKSSPHGPPIRLMYRNEKRMQNEIMAHMAKSKEQINKLKEDDKDIVKSELEEYPSHQYYFQGAPSVSTIEKFLDDANNSKILSYHKSAKAKNYKKFSNKLVASNFGSEILNSNKSEALFIYSNNCHFCMRNGGMYEILALNSLKETPCARDTNFHRMNSDNNEIKELWNLHYTPIFILFRQGMKDRPFFYNRQSINFYTLKEFFEISKQYEIIDEKSFYSQEGNTKMLEMIL